MNHAMSRLRKTRGHKNVMTRHVRAHAKHAGNEAADALAKAAARDATAGGDYSAVLKQARDRFQEVTSARTGYSDQDSQLGQELGDG